MPADFTSFFVAGAGAAAALVGLLFVAVSISPERNVGPGAPAERQAVAEGAFTALTNAFFIALGALIPSPGIGWIALVVGAVSLWQSITTGARMLAGGGGVLMFARRLFYVGSGVAVYTLECVYALQVIGAFGHPNPAAAYGIVYLVMAVLAIGLARAWQLLGAPRRGLLGRLSPLQAEEASQATSAKRTSDTTPR